MLAKYRQSPALKANRHSRAKRKLERRLESQVADGITRQDPLQMTTYVNVRESKERLKYMLLLVFCCQVCPTFSTERHAMPARRCSTR